MVEYKTRAPTAHGSGEQKWDLRLYQVVALPMVIRRLPGGPPRKLIGDFSNTQKVLTGLEVPNEDGEETT